MSIRTGRCTRVRRISGALNMNAFNMGLYKGRALVITAWFFMGKGQIIGAAVVLKVRVPLDRKGCLLSERLDRD